MRIGNGAADQLQLDIYGELIDSIYLYNKFGAPISYDLWKVIVKLLEYLTDHWRERDEGIWEVRGGKQEFTYSRLMSWVAFERAARMARQRGLPGPLVQWLADPRRDLPRDHGARLVARSARRSCRRSTATRSTPRTC